MANLSKLDQEFVTKAAQDGLVEIKMAKLAQKKAHSDRLKDFANVMLDDHSLAKQRLEEVAKQIGIKLPKQLSESQKNLVDKMSKYKGDQFDRHFVSTILQEHKKDVSLYHRESEHGGNDELKHLAAEIAPVLEKHLDMAQSMQSGA
ncbi:DUF4142 domain-containing protein [Thiohalomonas denitrificans]|uniref:Putative membrane protein n=1 Tax=Thiohalomonas denitrificans TaxID=415747 RepID=A0A1G5QAF4_9GAMM|nr:DUF4142 domain-containing protein [Thiohalomonas denitrificans]SCZ58480.1 putative membrane protein [Thiohalomonas denitrificans]